MGLDTYLVKVKKGTEVDFDTDYPEVGYWRKCYGIDNLLYESCDRMIDENSGLITFNVLECIYDDACAKAAKVVRAVNKYKGFPFGPIDDIFELDDYDVDVYEYDDLEETINNIGDREYSDSIWGTIHTLATTILQLRSTIKDPNGDDYEYLYISSY